MALLKKVVKRTLQVLTGIIGILVLLVVLLLFLIRLPAIQNYICGKAVAFVSSKTHTKMAVKRLYIKFPKSVVIEGLYAEDLQHDTLLNLQKLEVGIDMLGLLKKRVLISNVELQNATANIHRNTDSVFNFNFFITAFASKNPNSKKEIKDLADTVGWQVQVGKVRLENIRARFYDEIGGTDIKGVIGSLALDMQTMDIKRLSFAGNELALANTDVSFIQSKSGGKSADTSIVLMPLLSLKKLQAQNVKFSFKASNLQFGIKAGNLLLLPDTIDLNGHVVKVKKLNLSNTQSFFAMEPATADTVAEQMEAEAQAGKGWQISGGELKLDSVDFKLDLDKQPRRLGSVDYKHLGLQNVNIDIADVFYSPQLISADIKNISLREQSGLAIKRLAAKGIYDDTHIQLNGLELIAGNTRISHTLGITYPSIKTLADDIGAMGLNAVLSNTRVAVNDIIYFLPDKIKQTDFFVANRGKVLVLNGRINGRLKDVTATGLQASLTGGTDLDINAHIVGLPDALNAYYDVQIKSLHTNSTALNDLTGGKLPAAIRIPQTLGLSGAVKGSIKDAAAQLNLMTSEGDITADVKFKMAPGDTLYSGTITTHNLNAGHILKQDTLLGKVSMTATVVGRNFSLAAMQDSLSAQISLLQFMQHNYQGIAINATADSSIYHAVVSIRDTALKMNLDAAASFVSGKEYINATAGISEIYFKRMNLLQDDIRAMGNLQLNTTGKLMDLNATARLDNVIVLKDEDVYRLDSLVVVSSSDSANSKLRLKSDLLSAGYDGNIKLTALPKVIINHINSYFTITGDGTLLGRDSVKTDSTNALVKNMIGNDSTATDSAIQKFNFALSIEPHPIITKLLLPKFENFTGASALIVYDAGTHSLALNAAASSLAYAGVKATDVSLKLNSDRKDMRYNVALQGLTVGPVKLSETSLDGSLADNKALFALRIHGADTLDKLRVGGTLEQDTAKTYRLMLDNNNLIIGNERWQLSERNAIRFGKAGFAIDSFDLSNSVQALSIKSSDANNGQITAGFNKFELGSLSQIVETDTALIRGTLDGNIEFRNTKKTPAFVSDLTISNIRFKDLPVGTLAVKADNLSGEKYAAQVLLSGSDNDAEIKGYYSNSSASNQLDFNVAIRKLNLISVQPFTFGQLRNSSGYLTGALTVTGQAKQPLINGNVRFKEAAFNLAYINNYLQLKDEEIAIDKQGVYFRQFNVLDSLGQRASVAGAVYTSDLFKTMKFNVNVTTNNFTVLNTTIKDNELFFGHVLLSSNISIRGNEALPDVNVKATLLEGTNFAVVLPGSKITVDRGEGVVELTDSASSIFNNTGTDTLSLGMQFKGIKLQANLQVTPKTTLKLIVDKNSGDSLVIKGEGQISFAINESGNQNITGIYRINAGAYKATFQKIIKRELTIQPGGYITFNGSPTDALVDITAVYSVKTSPSDLLSSELVSATTGEKNTFKKPLNFRVLMRMSGQLMKPDISFKLDMDESDQNAFGGSVYAKINALNNDPSELYKQVFSLLLMKKFLPAGLGGGGSDPAAGNVYANAATSLARNSLNQVLTDQLNQLSGRYIKFVDLSVGINANDEYTSAGVNQNTQVSVGLKKSFFKERLSVQVGTSINVANNNGEVKGLDANNLTGDIVIEYKINEDGSLRFKAFRENQYEGLIDGSLYKTGVGVVFSKDYDREKELLVRLPKAERKAKKKLEKEQKEKEKQEKDAADQKKLEEIQKQVEEIKQQ